MMHSLRCTLVSSAAHLPISSQSPQRRKSIFNSYWVSTNYLPICSKSVERSISHYLRHSLIWVNGENENYSRQKTLRPCTSGEGDAETLPDVENTQLSGLVEEEVDKILKSEENRALLKDLETAMQRVDTARRELDEVEKREKDAAELRAYIQRLESTDSMIAECQREVSDAEARVRKAELALVTARAGSSILDLSHKWEEGDIDEDVERGESVKASALSALIGTLASIPTGLLHAKSVEGLLISEGIIFISCALFGVTYRYTVRQDLENFQLKTGTVAAFGLVRGLSQFEAEFPVDFDVNITLSHALEAALMVGESVLIFIFAAIALDYCLKVNLLNPFPSRR